MVPHETQKLLCSKGHCHWENVTIYRKENIFTNFTSDRGLICKTHISRQSNSSSDRLEGWGRVIMPFGARGKAFQILSSKDVLYGSSLEDGEIGRWGQTGKQMSSLLHKYEGVGSSKRLWASGLDSHAFHKTGLEGKSTVTQYPWVTQVEMSMGHDSHRGLEQKGEMGAWSPKYSCPENSAQGSGRLSKWAAQQTLSAAVLWDVNLVSFPWVWILLDLVWNKHHDFIPYIPRK